MVVHDHVGKEKVLPREVEIVSPIDGGSDGPCVQTVHVKKDKDTALVRHRDIIVLACCLIINFNNVNPYLHCACDLCW